LLDVASLNEIYVIIKHEECELCKEWLKMPTI